MRLPKLSMSSSRHYESVVLPSVLGVMPAKTWCYSAKNCGGKVLSNRDGHNCKTKSRGKSVYSNGDQQVYQSIAPFLRNSPYGIHRGN